MVDRYYSRGAENLSVVNMRMREVSLTNETMVTQMREKNERKCLALLALVARERMAQNLDDGAGEQLHADPKPKARKSDKRTETIDKELKADPQVLEAQAALDNAWSSFLDFFVPLARGYIKVQAKITKITSSTRLKDIHEHEGMLNVHPKGASATLLLLLTSVFRRSVHYAQPMLCTTSTPRLSVAQ
ncbi:hypothetical protein BOTBODRAFT_58045 [Botryobasidium botryosum FD-172 SS1]|uniref:Uncharacterized protein n=1 Tax=Botryobasidium botryosum (strain FD-172 SS1) TaxID=930990 RepID=A0A067M4L5_BOTB1|nr:hypothetical protein BOTBODRAFT_58045 [Botryobasidium botryosum FD-172 SS1]